jgi:hypothetical protein
MRLAGKIALHLLLIGIVVLVPPLLFDRLNQAGIHDSIWVFSGGLTYPLYLGWWVSRIRQPIIRTILLHLIAFTTVASALVMSLDKRTAGFAPFVPAAALLPCLACAVVRGVQGRRSDIRAHLYALLLLLPFALGLTALILFGLAMTSMQGMRW